MCSTNKINYVTPNTTFVERDLSQRILDNYLDNVETQSVSLFQSTSLDSFKTASFFFNFFGNVCIS